MFEQIFEHPLAESHWQINLSSTIVLPIIISEFSGLKYIDIMKVLHMCHRISLKWFLPLYTSITSLWEGLGHHLMKQTMFSVTEY